MSRKTTSVQLTKINQRILDILCDDLDMSQSNVINEAIRYYFQHYETELKAKLDKLEKRINAA